MKERVESFIAIAREDLEGARELLPRHPRLAAFHIEQAAEKLLKAVLTVEAIDFTSGHHQLGRLAELLPPDHLWRADLIEFDRYTTFATSTRYPRPGGGMPSVPTKETLEAAIRHVSSLIGEIEDWCHERLKQQPRPEPSR